MLAGKDNQTQTYLFEILKNDFLEVLVAIVWILENPDSIWLI